MKSTKKLISYLMALAMVSSAAILAVSADDDDEDDEPIVGTVSEGFHTQSSVEYEVFSNGEAKIVYVDANVGESVTIPEKITVRDNGVTYVYTVTDVEDDAFADASKLKTITVNSKNEWLRSVDGCLYYIINVTYKDSDSDKKNPIFHDELVAVPAAKTSFNLSNTCEKIGGHPFYNDKTIGNVAKDNDNFLVAGSKLYSIDKSDNWVKENNEYVNKPTIKPGTMINDSIKWAGGVGNGGNSGTGTNDDSNAPQTGVAGVGVAIATLLVAGSTAIVLRKRGRK